MRDILESLELVIQGLYKDDKLAIACLLDGLSSRPVQTLAKEVSFQILKSLRIWNLGIKNVIFSIKKVRRIQSIVVKAIKVVCGYLKPVSLKHINIQFVFTKAHLGDHLIRFFYSLNHTKSGERALQHYPVGVANLYIEMLNIIKEEIVVFDRDAFQENELKEKLIDKINTVLEALHHVQFYVNRDFLISIIFQGPLLLLVQGSQSDAKSLPVQFSGQEKRDQGVPFQSRGLFDLVGFS